MSSHRLNPSGRQQDDLVIFPQGWEIEPSNMPEIDGDGYDSIVPLAPLPAFVEAQPAPLAYPAADLLRLWVRPRPVLWRAARNGQSWILPIGLALVFFYAHFFVMAYLGTPDLNQILLRGVAGIVLGWFTCAGVLLAGSRVTGGWPTFLSMLTMSAWATLPLTLRHLVQLIYSLSTGAGITAPGLSGLAFTLPGGGLPGPVVTLLGYIDLYTLWHLGLLVVMIRLIGQRSPIRSLALLVGYGVLSVAVGSLLPH